MAPAGTQAWRDGRDSAISTAPKARKNKPTIAVLPLSEPVLGKSPEAVDGTTGSVLDGDVPAVVVGPS